MNEPKETTERKIFSLTDVARSLQKTISDRYSTAFWLKAEINKLNIYKHSGHCYPDLVEKKDGKVVAQMRATLWKDDFRAINQKFIDITKEPLRDGIKVLMLVKISYEPNYGLGLKILDIDASFTLGDLEREKQETINALQELGIFEQNKKITFPFLPKRIAVVSVETSKGYADFMKILETNPEGFKFQTHLFPSLLQGDGAVKDICQKLAIIKGLKESYDVVVIVRGGGGEVGLTCYNHQMLCETIANFPIPVLTGIGHATNVTVAEMVAHFNAITPTKLAEFLIQKFDHVHTIVENAAKWLQTSVPNTINFQHKQHQQLAKTIAGKSKSFLLTHQNQCDNITHALFRFSNQQVQQQKKEIDDHSWKLANKTLRIIQKSKEANTKAADKIFQLSQHATESMKTQLSHLSENLCHLAQHKKDTFANQLKHTQHWLVHHAQNQLKERNIHLNHLDKNIKQLDVENTLKRGYSMIYVEGKLVKTVDEVKKKTILQTRVSDGFIESVVTNVKKNGEN